MAQARFLFFNGAAATWSQMMRLGTWGTIALAAVLTVAVAANTDRGSQRLAGLFGPRAPSTIATRPTTTGPQFASRPFDPEIEARRQGEALKLLAADRDRLLARIATLERNLDGVTGSITPRAPREQLASSPLPPAPSPAAPPPSASTPLVLPPVDLPAGPAPRQAPVVSTPAAPPAQPAQPANRVTGAHQTIANTPAATGSVATKTEFGIDLGASTTIEGLRSQWAALKNGHAALFDGLRPVVAVREGQKPGTLELRLVAGPLSNAGAAARLCAALTAAGRACQPAVFDGQRLAIQ